MNSFQLEFTTVECSGRVSFLAALHSCLLEYEGEMNNICLTLRPMSISLVDTDETGTYYHIQQRALLSEMSGNRRAKKASQHNAACSPCNKLDFLRKVHVKHYSI